MKINRKNNTIRLSALETRMWEDSGPDGYEFRKSVRDAARSIIRVSGKSVEIYASESKGGWTADVLDSSVE